MEENRDQTRREPLVADKMIVRSDGKDGRHTVYISVSTQDKKPVPEIHIVIKDSFGKQIFEGTTNDRGVIDPHPVITPRARGINHYNVYAEGTALVPEPLRLDGPPRYPKPPTPPDVIPPEDHVYVGRNPVKAVWRGFWAGRKALQEQKEKTRGSQEQQAQEEELP